VGDAVSDDLKGEALDITDRVVTRLPVTHHAWQVEDLRDPPAVFLPSEFNRHVHYSRSTEQHLRYTAFFVS
jgi:hypothetical protein